MSYTSLIYHIAFATKDRRPQVTDELRPRLCQYIGGIIRDEGGQMLEANGPADHIHVAAIVPPTVAIASFLRDLKAGSSRWVHDTFANGRDFGWQDGYAAFTVSRSGLPKLLAYIRNQQEHHKTVTFREELIALLERHGIEYDERYL